DEFHVKPEIDPETEIREIIDFMKTYVKHNPFIKSFVLGISGGQDSTLLGKMVQMAVDELNQEPGGGYAFHALRLPYRSEERRVGKESGSRRARSEETR